MLRAIVSTLVLALGAPWAAESPKYAIQGHGASFEEPQSAVDSDVAQMVVSGRVLGQDGKPVEGCQVAVLTRHYGRSEKPIGYWPQGFHPGLASANRVMAAGKADAAGRFRLAGPRYAPALPTIGAVLLASAPGHSLTAEALDDAAAAQEVTITLQPERAVRGRLTNSQGEPVVGVEVRLYSPPVQDTPLAPRGLLGAAFGYVPPVGAFWPKPVVTDDQGRFLLRRLGPGNATLEIRGDKVNPQRFSVETAAPEAAKDIALKLAPGPRLEGRVTEEGNGKPVPNTRVVVVTGANEIVETRADEAGRYAVRPFAGKSFKVVFHPPEGSAHLITRTVVRSGTADRQELSPSLPCGVPVRGQVTETDSGKPVAGARVQYRQRHHKNPWLRKGTDKFFTEEGLDRPSGGSTLQTAISGADGRFELAVPPGPGHLFVLGPTSDYVHVPTSAGELEFGKPGGLRYYPDAVAPLDLKPGAEVPELTLKLRPGVTLRGRVLDPAGKPVERFLVLCRSYIPTGWHWWQTRNYLQGRDGRFELPGCDPAKTFTAWFFDPTSELGATAELTAKPGNDEPAMVRLERCGKAVVRVVDFDGKPQVGYLPIVSFVVTPGAHEPPFFPEADRPLEGDWTIMPFWGFDPKYHGAKWERKLTTDAEGKVTIPKLIPGATYRIVSQNHPTGPKGREVPHVADFVVKPGETRALTFIDRP